MPDIRGNSLEAKTISTTLKEMGNSTSQMALLIEGNLDGGRCKEGEFTNGPMDTSTREASGRGSSMEQGSISSKEPSTCRELGTRGKKRANSNCFTSLLREQSPAKEATWSSRATSTSQNLPSFVTDRNYSLFNERNY